MAESDELRSRITALDKLQSSIEDALLESPKGTVPKEVRTAIVAALTELHHARWDATWTLCDLLASGTEK